MKKQLLRMTLTINLLIIRVVTPHMSSAVDEPSHVQTPDVTGDGGDKEGCF